MLFAFLVLSLKLLQLNIELLKLLYELLHYWSCGNFRIGAISIHDQIAIFIERWWRNFTLFPGLRNLLSK
jgi:hypothetical protein